MEQQRHSLSRTAALGSGLLGCALLGTALASYASSFEANLLVFVRTAAFSAAALIIMLYEREVPDTTLDDFESRFNKAVHANMYIDDSRSVVVQNARIALLGILDGSYANRNRFRVLILGRKASGKTLLLRTLMEAACFVTRGAFSPCFIEFSDPTTSALPSTHMFWAMSLRTKLAYFWFRIKYPLESRITIINEALVATGARFFVAVDELQNVYTRDCKIGSGIVGELNTLGGLNGRAIFAILAGSSTHLRALVTAKLPDDRKSTFPHYSHIDLNSTKFKPITIYSFSAPKECAKALEFIAKKIGQKPPLPADRQPWTEDDEHRLSGILFKTGGCAGLLYNALNNPETFGAEHTVSLGGFASNNPILRALHEVVALHSRGVVGIQALEAATRLVNFDLVVRTMKTEVSIDDLLSQVYNLVDVGKLRFDDWGEEKRVGFASPTAFVELSRDTGAFSALSLLRLQIFDPLEAERITLVCLAKSTKWLGESLVSHDVSDLVLPNPGKDERISPYCREDVTDRMLKETYGARHHDTFGADGVVLLADSNGGVTAHRLQVKLGKKSVDLLEAEGWASRFESMFPIAREAYERAGLIITKEHRYIVTTRPMLPAARDVLENHKSKIRVLDSKYLNENVWPEEVK